MADIKNITIDGTTYDLKDDKARNDITDLKEDFTDLPEYGYVPTAGQMMSDNVTVDTEPYNYRATPYGDREIVDAIVGGSIVWNQLIDSDDTSISIPTGHKCVMRINDSWGVGIDTGVPIPVTGGSDMCFDITQMFTPSVADAVWNAEIATPSSASVWFRKMFPDEYYPYNEGELKHVSGLSAHETVGFNVWDEEWRVGYYDSQTGEFQPYTSQIANVNPIRVFPNTEYYIYPLSVMNGARIIYRDGNNNLIGVDMHQPGSPYFTTPENCEYINFCTMSSYGATYKHDICINISDPTRNGTYEPYQKHSYAFDDSLTLMGVPKWVDGKLKFDGDVYGADGSVQRRYGIVDLGTLNWTYTSTDGGVFYATFTDTPHGTLNMICPKYTTVKYADRVDKTISRYYAFQDGLNIVDSAYTDAATFKTAMSGVYLVYELKTPTTETAEPYQQIQVCPNGGTEEYISTSIVPVGHSTRYPENSRMKLDGLPWDFSTLIAPTEKAYKATRNYTTGQLLIVKNVLYKVTANIANGGTITPNTNVTATTLSEVIASL